MSQKKLLELREKIYNCIRELETPFGINASGKDGKFGCIFGRDSFITIIKILKTQHLKKDHQLLSLCKKSLLMHVSLQGKQENIQSGEQPGKFIHEYRTDKYENLINRPRPWYVYPDNILRNFDSIDSTPLGLWAIYKFWEVTQDEVFLQHVLPAVKKALVWIETYADMDKDGIVEYELHSQRKFGGLVVQSWADSAPSLANEQGVFPSYPIAPVEVQGMCWLALQLWGNYFLVHGEKQMGKNCIGFARKMQKAFVQHFLLKSNNRYYFAQALDGEKNQITTITANPLLCLWASYEKDNVPFCIIPKQYREDIVARVFKKDMFLPHAGIRTMSDLSPTYNGTEQSYHNGSFWPILNGLIIEGLENFGYFKEARVLTSAMLEPIHHFGTPIELYIEKEGSYIPYKSIYGQKSSSNQAWSAAALYDVLLCLTHPL